MDKKRTLECMVVIAAMIGQAGVVAAQCAPTRVPFAGESECAKPGFYATGFGLGSGIQVNLRNGFSAMSRGYDGNGNRINSCYAEDFDPHPGNVGTGVGGCSNAVTRDITGLGHPT